MSQYFDCLAKKYNIRKPNMVERLTGLSKTLPFKNIEQNGDGTLSGYLDVEHIPIVSRIALASALNSAQERL